MSIENKKKLTSSWFQNLQNQMISSFESLDTKKFQKKTWDRPGGGGGIMAIMKGEVFEKVGVNSSVVHGKFSDEFRKKIPGTENSAKFWAAGISIVAHMKNPKIAAAHFNTRFIATEKSWFGGGCDLTPAVPDEKETKSFHQGLENLCKKNTYDYPKWKKDCDEYFYLKHRKEPRGVGGIFFDYLNEDNFDNEFNFIKDLGVYFKDFVHDNTVRKKDLSYNAMDIIKLMHKRSRYVEFNLLYDRGTLFGLKTDGNVEAILMSMPPKAEWN
ncbi:MAG: oxygen-dependent coproporphyrinogen oxidase [Candidatus Pelagibacter sp.]|nr:oxygen-dependent coproporphyrinogen oxidase [Candidatus Pelagibacter sp.]